jgi:sulfonate transport system ATP-binding protein
MVMCPRPGRIFDEIDLDLPRPRDRQSAAFDFVKRRVLAALDRSLNRAASAAGETKADAGAAMWW